MTVRAVRSMCEHVACCCEVHAAQEATPTNRAHTCPTLFAHSYPAVPMVEMPGPSPSSGKPMGVQAPAGEMPAIPPPLEAAPAAEQPASGGGGWFGSWFSGGKKEEEAATPAAPTDLSHDPFAPPPMPHFGAAPEPQFR